MKFGHKLTEETFQTKERGSKNYRYGRLWDKEAEGGGYLQKEVDEENPLRRKNMNCAKSERDEHFRTYTGIMKVNLNGRAYRENEFWADIERFDKDLSIFERLSTGEIKQWKKVGANRVQKIESCVGTVLAKLLAEKRTVWKNGLFVYLKIYNRASLDLANGANGANGECDASVRLSLAD